MNKEIMWAIAFRYGKMRRHQLYVGTSLTKKDAISNFCKDRGIDWKAATKKGNRVVKVTLSFNQPIG